jgi:hypothetical protein
MNRLHAARQMMSNSRTVHGTNVLLDSAPLPCDIRRITTGGLEPNRMAGTTIRNLDGHDPWWDLDGLAARDARRRASRLAPIALLVSLIADAAVALGWAMQLGLAGAGLQLGS